MSLLVVFTPKLLTYINDTTKFYERTFKKRIP
jgi:hypothetical protein